MGNSCKEWNCIFEWYRSCYISLLTESFQSQIDPLPPTNVPSPIPLSLFLRCLPPPFILHQRHQVSRPYVCRIPYQPQFLQPMASTEFLSGVRPDDAITMELCRGPRFHVLKRGNEWSSCPVAFPTIHYSILQTTEQVPRKSSLCISFLFNSIRRRQDKTIQSFIYY